MDFNFKKSYLILAAVALVVVLFFGSSMFITVQPGERGVIFRPFSKGLDKENIYIPGFHVVAPWNTLIIYDVKEQQREETMDVLDKNGLSVSVEISVRFNPTYNKIGYLHEVFGTRYIDQLIIPEVRSSVRQVAGRYTAEEIYSTKRSEVEASIISETKEVLSNNNIDMKALLIRSINLPEKIKQAIEKKLEEEQAYLTYQYTLETAKQEAEKRRIDAEGIARYNRIIDASLTNSILKQRGIEATIELATSPNSKVVVVGSGKDGLPLILGNN
ncbi:prohibitin family protein [Sunxiuqinia elliptica]|uniref:Regulator of protease activity HflC, stomatin/prohibitin superfamily n=1 Tax=Sunxiuqinia elliptica TaxID=655355 RepID=A0A1I2KQV3_9BACT|nr:prohibitin family protein [Sunxiuqinia elliptica]SFF69325.1 Regulator of protease activity HflC, stomatin/prohibitin superfamily [Sunxiuqinia elliptica]